MKPITQLLRFYFITDDGPSNCSMVEQVRIAVAAGATMIQYRNKQFGLHFYEELNLIRQECHKANIPLLVNDNVLLAKAVAADGVHLGQDDDPPQLARKILGPRALIGLSVSSTHDLEHSQLADCDYLGCGPVYATDTKLDTTSACGLDGLKAVVDKALLPVVAIGGISADNAANCLQQGAAGIAVISAITRAAEPEAAAHHLADVCRVSGGPVAR